MCLESPRRSGALVLAAALCLSLAACASVTAVRLQPDAIDAGPGLRPIAGIQANATSLYVAFIPIPGGVKLDNVINRMLVATAKTMGADKIANLRFEITPSNGIWTLRRLLGWRSARASGIAVQVIAPAPDPDAALGPEGPEAIPADAPSRTASEAQ